jgi:DNA-binding XRE family transcriptional regulator
LSRKLKSGTQLWASKIAAFRQSLKLSQQDFGTQVGTTAMSVSRWERGEAEPPADAYLRMGTVAGDPLCWYFWDRAGLSISDVERVLPSAEKRRRGFKATHGNVVHAGAAGAMAAATADFVTIPLLPIAVGTIGADGDREADIAISQPESLLAAPTGWCPHPRMTFCLRVKGNSMSPLILDGYIIAVDTSQVARDDLVGEIVVAQHITRGLLVSRLIRFGHTDVLVSDHREYESVAVESDSDWKLVGKVLWWTGRAR